MGLREDRAVPEVPLIDINAQNRTIWPELRAAIDPVVAEGQFILGPAVERFERHFAEYVGARHCVGLDNGTSALHMALIACDIGPGDEVITTPLTWISTSWAISYVGATPVYVDIDPTTYTLDPERVARAITPRTRAILPVHLYGHAAELEPLWELCQAHGLILIEDAAQAHGARYAGRHVGTLGRVGCFSFYPGKNLGAFGEAGAIVTDEAAVAERVRGLRDHAQRGRHHHVEIGFNSRMDGLQGAVLDAKLRHLDRWNALRARHARRYQELLADVPGLFLPRAAVAERHAWHLFVILVRGRSRHQLRELLSAARVMAGIHYPTLVPYQPAYARLGYSPGDFPVAEDVAVNCLSLPLYPEMTDEQIEQVTDVLRACLAVPGLANEGVGKIPQARQSRSPAAPA
jgi:dTDP-4-amino-4,6-dideoxygalactose transaminase